MSAILIRLNERALLRLETPATLTERDQETFDALLSPDERAEVWRRYSDIKHVRDLMTHMLLRTQEYVEIGTELDNYAVDIMWDRREYMTHVNTLGKLKAQLPTLRNPEARASAERSIEIHTEIVEGYLNRMVGFYDALSPQAQRFIKPFNRPITSPDDVRRYEQDRDLIFFPGWLTALQQAYKEVLSLKLEALKS
ncbi:hypothetical protein ACKU27_02990 [Sphingobium yanoikuyae]|jgi:hypothetical protein|uniref:hypothetical protein n=1 Tax=Sphingobium yanoikuyae TaxID=13690 RepID=UPI0028A95369|nr:hypothetical protein [Sphingobium yanoikuyae]